MEPDRLIRFAVSSVLIVLISLLLRLGKHVQRVYWRDGVTGKRRSALGGVRQIIADARRYGRKFVQ